MRILFIIMRISIMFAMLGTLWNNAHQVYIAVFILKHKGLPVIYWLHCYYSPFCNTTCLCLGQLFSSVTLRVSKGCLHLLSHHPYWDLGAHGCLFEPSLANQPITNLLFEQSVKSPSLLLGPGCKAIKPAFPEAALLHPRESLPAQPA